MAQRVIPCRNKLDKPFSVIVSIKLVLLAEWGQECLYSVILPMSPVISVFVLKVDFILIIIIKQVNVLIVSEVYIAHLHNQPTE